MSIGDPDPRSNKKAYFDLIDISESAFSLHNKVFMDNLRSIILYAVFGTICNFLMIGEYMGGRGAVYAVLGTILYSLIKGE